MTTGQNTRPTPSSESQRRRMINLLQMMATERTGWRAFFRRWYFPHEPLRNSAADLLREIGVIPILEDGTRLVGDDTKGR